MKELFDRDWQSLSTEELKEKLDEPEIFRNDIRFLIKNIISERQKISSDEYGVNFAAFLRAGVANRED